MATAMPLTRASISVKSFPPFRNASGGWPIYNLKRKSLLITIEESFVGMEDGKKLHIKWFFTVLQKSLL